MTIQNTEFSPAPTSDDSSSLTPEQIAGARGHWASLGLDPAKFDLALSGAAPLDGLSTQPGPEGTDLVDMKLPALTDQQAREMAAELIKAGVPADRVAAAMREDGHDVTAEAEDTRTDDQKEMDAFLGPAPSSGDFRIDYVGHIPEDVDAGGLAAFDALARTWLAEVGFPPSIGAAVIERALDVGHRYNAMSEVEQALWRAEQVVVFEQMAGGPEKAAERLELAKKALARARVFPDALHAQAGVLYDAGIAMHLALQEERRGVRAAG